MSPTERARHDELGGMRSFVFAIRVWLTLAASLYLIVGAALFGLGAADSGLALKAFGWFVFAETGPILVLYGAIRWGTTRSWVATAFGELVMIAGLAPLISASPYLFPFVAISLVGVLPWGRRAGGDGGRRRE